MNKAPSFFACLTHSTLTLTLAKAMPTTADKNAPDTKRMTMTNYTSRILIVDDQTLMREHMQRLLAREGYELAYAVNGVDALQKVTEFAPDLVLLDVRMPEMDGFEVCRRLRADPHTADIPVIMVTAFDDREARLEGLDAGADDFIPKPYDSIELRARVRTITRLNRYRRLMAERTKFQLVVERSENGYILVNNEDEIIFANAKARLLLGQSIEATVPLTQPFLTLAQRKYRCESEQAWHDWPGWEHDNTPRFLVRPETIESSALWLRVETIDYLLADDQMVWVVALKNVTEQMAAKHDVWKFQRAIHHKMRTPLIGMYTGVQFLHDYMAELPQKDVEELVQTALEHGDRLKNAIEDILRYVDSPTLARGGQPFALASLPELVGNMQKVLGLEHVSWSGFEEVAETTAVLSERPMELILYELLENAQKFHPEQQPTIEIQLKRLDANTVRLVVQDNGRVLTPEQLADVWSPYYQVEKNFTGEVVGMGLGLPTVASLMWSVGGRCRIFNRSDDAGMGVELVLPVVE